MIRGNQSYIPLAIRIDHFNVSPTTSGSQKAKYLSVLLFQEQASKGCQQEANSREVNDRRGSRRRFPESCYN